MRHNTLYKYIGALCALALCSCQSKITDGSGVSEVISLSVQAPVSGPKSESKSFVADDRMGLYVVDYRDANTAMPLQISGNRANNVALSFNGVSWTAERPVYWGEQKADIYAYYPYMESIVDVNEQPFSIACDQSTSCVSSDLLWAKAEGVSNTGAGVSLAMSHLMSKLTVKLVAGKSYIGSLPDDATILLHNTVTDAVVNLENGSVTKAANGEAKSITMHKLGLMTVDGVKAVVYEAIVVPQMITSFVPLLEINSKSVSYMVEDKLNFKPGTAYAYTVTLNASTTAIQVEIGCEIEDWNSTGSGSTGGNEGGEGVSGSGGDDGKAYIDLSSEGTANCYLISEAGDYKIRAVMGNTDGTIGNVKSVEVLWESFGTDVMPNVGDLIDTVSFKDGYIRFSTPSEFKNGNAVIAAKNKNGVILWSWHIWCSEEGWQDQVYYNDAGIMMDRNLGATSATPGDVGALGLLYQWGRKDPFLGSSSISYEIQAASTITWPAPVVSSASIGTIVYAQQHPTTFICRYEYSQNDWHYADRNNNLWQKEKTAYDPCPHGYRVPDGGAKGIWAKSFDLFGELGSTDLFDTTNRGMDFSITKITLGAKGPIWYPAASALSGQDGKFYYVGAHGCYWSATSCERSDYNYLIYELKLTSNDDISTSATTGRASALSVRCCKE